VLAVTNSFTSAAAYDGADVAPVEDCAAPRVRRVCGKFPLQGKEGAPHFRDRGDH
jgi:hypothetical protein